MESSTASSSETEVPDHGSSKRVTRLAPSPTGAFHLGNARTFLINWAIARQQGWRILLRIDDLDGPRVKPEAVEQAIRDLGWLGIDWDEGPDYQSLRQDDYIAALQQLSAQKNIYSCRCTRSEIQAAALSAPHQGDHELRYPGTCRPDSSAAWPTFTEFTNDVAWRTVVPHQEFCFDDQLLGTQRANIQRTVGDFLVATKKAVPSYQLATVVDDRRSGVTDVVRGNDLLDSTARQMLMYQQLGWEQQIPHYWHLAIVVGSDGRRLAKRHGDTRLQSYRDQGVAAERVIGLLSDWCGGERRPMSATEFMDTFDVRRLDSEPITFTDADDAWLQGG